MVPRWEFVQEVLGQPKCRWRQVRQDPAGSSKAKYHHRREAFGDEKLEWLRQFRPFKSGIPTRHSIARMLRTVDTQQLALALYSWVDEQRKKQDQPIIALDGKTVRGAVNRNAPPETLHLVSAYDTQKGLVLFQQANGGKGTEIQAVKEL